MKEVEALHAHRGTLSVPHMILPKSSCLEIGHGHSVVMVGIVSVMLVFGMGVVVLMLFAFRLIVGGGRVR
jgi:hypothetical protein